MKYDRGFNDNDDNNGTVEKKNWNGNSFVLEFDKKETSSDCPMNKNVADKRRLKRKKEKKRTTL